jgi:hypothetical protein
MKMDVHYAVVAQNPAVCRLEMCQMKVKDVMGLLALFHVVFCEVNRLKLYEEYQQLREQNCVSDRISYIVLIGC